jgi:prepilin-type N-terminal cleavage/methylation domain-containing protein
LPAAGRQEGGYSLVELIAVMSIFLIILTALTTLFASGAKAELDMNRRFERRFEAQQNARLGLDKLRRELHCSSGITATDGTPLPATPVTAIKVTLPSHCPSAGGANITVVYDTVLVSANRWKLQRTKSGGTAVPVADYLTNDDVFTYYAQSTASRARLHVDLPVNVNPNEGWKQWRLVDDIVLRNTLRQ